MSKKDIVKRFNNITKDLLKDMNDILGDKYFTKFKLIIRMNSTLPINKFKLNVLKFKKYILDKDPNYFINDDIILNEINSDNSLISDKEYYLNEYYNLKNIYINIDDKSRENFWDILKVLIFLCESYHTKI